MASTLARVVTVSTRTIVPGSFSIISATQESILGAPTPQPIVVNNTPYTLPPGVDVTFGPKSVSSSTTTTASSTSSTTSTTPTVTTSSSSSSKASAKAKTSSSSTLTTKTTTSTGKTTPAAKTTSSGISKGAAAGIGIGCAVAGALIAAALIALILMSRKRRRPARSDDIPLNGFTSVEKSGASLASPDPGSSAGLIERHLPQPAEDRAIGGEMSKLKTLIKNHVQSYYHMNAVRGGASSIDQTALGNVAAENMPLITSSLGSLMANPSTRMVAIRFCIAWMAISRIDSASKPDITFLPPEVMSCVASMTSMRDDPQTRMAFMSRWRAMTASLLQRTYGSSAFSSSDPRNRNISDALHALNAVLRPFVDEQRDNEERGRKLEEIMRRAARYGLTLFSQPSTWGFDWDTPANAGRGSLVIYPALVQSGDDNGRRLDRPRIVEEQELARGLESYL